MWNPFDYSGLDLDLINNYLSLNEYRYKCYYEGISECDNKRLEIINSDCYYYTTDGERKEKGPFCEINHRLNYCRNYNILVCGFCFGNSSWNKPSMTLFHAKILIPIIAALL
jgi:hypothetical protein